MLSVASGCSLGLLMLVGQGRELVREKNNSLSVGLVSLDATTTTTTTTTTTSSIDIDDVIFAASFLQMSRGRYIPS